MQFTAVCARDLVRYSGQQTDSIYFHQITDHTDSLSAQQIIEFRDSSGLTKWFASDFMKAVCLDEKCNMVNIPAKVYNQSGVKCTI